jgi:FkbM family methyltransferase
VSLFTRARNSLETARLSRALAPTRSVPLVRLGSRYGGWVVPSELLDGRSIVYSGGVGEDVTFDLELIARAGCEIWAFDPTPRAIAFARAVQEERFHFLPVGLWSSDGSRRFYGPDDPRHVSHSALGGRLDRAFFDAECRSLETLMRDLEHERIDLLKLDIEGAEYEVLGAMSVRPACICVELHAVRPLEDIVDFVRELPYEVLNVEGWNVTLKLAERVETEAEIVL